MDWFLRILMSILNRINGSKLGLGERTNQKPNQVWNELKLQRLAKYD